MNENPMVMPVTPYGGNGDGMNGGCGEFGYPFPQSYGYRNPRW